MTSRRHFLQASAAAAAVTALPTAALAQKSPLWIVAIVKYLESHARDDGGYGWEGQEHSHLTPTFAVVGCYHLLSLDPPNIPALAQFIRTHHPRELKKLDRVQKHFDWQQIQALVWLGEDVSDFKDLASSWKEPRTYPKQYEQHGYPVFQHEIAPILCRQLLGLPAAETPAGFSDYVNSRHRKNGTFNNTPADDNTDGHILNTWWGLQALRALAPSPNPFPEFKNELIAWLRSCQMLNGGFCYQPSYLDPNKPGAAIATVKGTGDGASITVDTTKGRQTWGLGGWDDVAYTWAAVRSLHLLGARPKDMMACLNYLNLLRNPDNGFSDRPGWLSNPLATYYAVDTLKTLGYLGQPTADPIDRRFNAAAPQTRELKVFSIQIEAHGQGSPADAVELAGDLNIHLWGTKNAKPEWINRAQQLAIQQGASVKFFAANEGYGTWIDIPGLGTYSHMCDSFAPFHNDGSIPSLAGENNLTWSEFNAGLLSKLQAARGHLFWQFGENEPLVRMLLDESLKNGMLRNALYAAISTFHFGNPDFTNTEPFLMRYRGQIPFVALQDAHGPQPWWFADTTTGFRTLFLAEQPNWGGWLDALKYNRVVAVRHDADSGGKTWMHGLPEVIDVVREQWKSWQWWDNPAIERPLASLVALTPNDDFETGRPDRGIALRVRLARENTAQGLPKEPLAEFVSLAVAGQIVEAQLIERRRPNGVLEDAYHLYNWPDAPPGRHSASVTFRRPNTDTTLRRSITFTV
jgi:prenyltransferase beta subunit